MYKVRIKKHPGSRIDRMNHYSLLLHALLACMVCLTVEWISRHSITDAVSFLTGRPLVFLYNAGIVFVSLLFVYLFQRRAAMRTIITFFWLLLGTINGCVLAKRVSPFGFSDIKLIRDLFAMQSNYFNAKEATIAITAVVILFIALVLFWIFGPRYQGKVHRVSAAVMTAVALMLVPGITRAAVDNEILVKYFENLAQGYKDYGFLYSFSASVFDQGMSTPENYSEEAIMEVLSHMQAGNTASASAEEEDEYAFLELSDEKELTEAEAAGAPVRNNTVKTASAEEYPNIICVLLESFVDPEELNFLELSEDPVPNFRFLYDNYSSGYLNVPVVGAGTANTEFEILTGMSMQFFGLGEYPYKTILRQTNCESIASDLSEIGYGTHAVHNNGGNFYGRSEIFSMMGFDTFTSKEMMPITEYTPLGTWPTDEILIREVEKSLDYTPDQPDFVYTITVQGHGDYPREKILSDPEIRVNSDRGEEINYAWEYYVNQIHEVDKFIAGLIEMLEQRDEKTVMVLFGDHLPTLGLTEEDMYTGSIFKTKYITWNNIGMEKQDADLTSYQLLAEVLNQMDLHVGTMFQYHQNRDVYALPEEYISGLEMLQYDILYGEHYVYGGEDPYPASDLIMGTQDVHVFFMRKDGKYTYLLGDNFTRWSKVFIDEEKIKSKWISSGILRIKSEYLPAGKHDLVVKQMGSSNTVFRVSNTYRYNKKEEQTE